MAIDLVSYLANLKVVDVWKPGNPSGIVTDRRLYEDKVRLTPPKGMVAHGTAAPASSGLNSLAYLAGGSINDGRWVSADQYIPKNGTLYNVIPTDRYCWHAGYGHWNGLGNLNVNFWGVEMENKEDGVDPFSEEQYVTLAASWCARSAWWKCLDINVCAHAWCAEDDGGPCVNKKGRKSDPFKFRWGKFWAYVYRIRQPEVWPASWNLALWNGGD